MQIYYFSESRAIINDLDVILHGLVLQIIDIAVFRVDQLNILMRTWKPVV
jgi:hypothetical protein